VGNLPSNQAISHGCGYRMTNRPRRLPSRYLSSLRVLQTAFQKGTRRKCRRGCLGNTQASDSLVSSPPGEEIVKALHHRAWAGRRKRWNYDHPDHRALAGQRTTIAMASKRIKGTNTGSMNRSRHTCFLVWQAGIGVTKRVVMHTAAGAVTACRVQARRSRMYLARF